MSDTIDDLQGYDYYEEIEYRNQQWADGIHEDRSGKLTLISDMSEDWIENVIEYFGGLYDVTPLEEELEKRQLTNQKNEKQNNMDDCSITSGALV